MSDDEATIEIMPQTQEPSPLDRPAALLIEVDDTMAGQLETAENDLPSAIRDLYAGARRIDHVEFFAWNLPESVLFAITAYSPDITTNVQQSLLEIIDGNGELQEPLQTLKEKIESEIPDSLTVKVGRLPFGMFGGGPAMTTRLVVDQGNQKLTHGKKINQPCLKTFLKEFADEQFLYYAHLRRNTSAPEKFQYQITARIALFNPEFRVGSFGDYTSRLEYGRRVAPAEHFRVLGVTSSLSLVDDQYHLSTRSYRSGVHPSRDGPFRYSERDLKHVNGDIEYDEIKRGGYGATDKLESICEYTSLLAREVDLNHFVTLGAAPSDVDPGENVPKTAFRGADNLGVDVSAITPEPVSIPADEGVDPADEILSQTPSTANDGTDLHWRAIQDSALAFKTDGYEVYIVTQDTGSRPDLWVKSPDGEIYAVEVESTTKSKTASVLSNIERQALWGYKTITVMVPQQHDDGRWQSLSTLADWMLETCAKPFHSGDDDLEDSRTRLYNRAETVEQDGWTMLLPEGVTEASWWVTPDNRCLLVDGRRLLAEGHMTDPLEDFEFHTPRYQERDGRYIVKDDDGERLQTCSEESDIANTQLSPPYRPVDLSYVDYVERIYCYDPDERELIQQDMIADWDTSQASTRNEQSHADAFGTFVVDRDEDVRLEESDCRPFIRNYIDSLSAHGPPAKNIYGSYRTNYYAKRSNNAEVGKVHHYPGASFRYNRGLVPPETNGLSTDPSFPAEWDIDSADVLGEPLIYGLDDIRDVGEDELPDDG